LSITDETNTEIDELSARFIRDALPLVDQLYHVARRHTCNHADAEDLVQDVMMRAYRNFDQFTDGTNIRRWLLRIMTNSRINGYRTAMRRPAEFLSDDVDGAQRSAGAARLSVVSPSAEARALQSLGDDEVKQAMHALPESQRMAVYYVDVEGLRYSDVAHVMDVPLGTVMSRVSRGRRRLRALLANKAAANGYLQNRPC